MQTLTVRSPSKVNLTLRVTGRYPTGYHQLHTIFHRISLTDRITLAKTREKFSLQTNRKDLPTDERNLITQTYLLLKKKFPKLGGVRVYLKKNIPSGGGLGGGSGNAAAFLLAMNKLYKLGLSRRQMLEMGRRLGADVPFFLYETNQAIATGRGDRIYPRASKKRWCFLLVLDNKELRTGDVFRKYQAPATPDSLTKIARTARMLCTFLDRGNPSAFIPLLRNDLEKPAFFLRPSIRKKIEKLNRAGFSSVRMSGSGPTVFILLPDDRDLERQRKTVQKLFPLSRVEKAKTF